jgi:imidazolonepropionase-like amidohydrolase
VRDVVEGHWAEPSGEPDDTVGDGLWAVPGLVDAHAHLAARELNTEPGVLSEAMERATEALAAGVTLVLDKGWGDNTTIQLIDQVDPAHRPEIEAAGRIITTEGGYFAGFGREIEGSEMGRVVSEAAAAARGWVKLIGDWPRRGVGPVANFTQDELATAVEMAEAAGARVAIHTMAREVPSQAVAAGVHSIEHGLFLEETDIELLGARGGMWVPTVLRVETTVRELGPESTGGRLLTEGLERMRALVPAAVEAGVHVLAGTDLIGSPASVAAEALRLGELGLHPGDIVAAISDSGFAATGRDHEFSVGTPANAVFFAANPLEELAVLRHPSHVMRLGRVL